MPIKININNRHLIFGLSWMPSGKANSKREKREFANKRNSNIGVTVYAAGKTLFGAARLTTFDKKEKKQTAYSGAALFLLFAIRHAKENESENSADGAKYILVADFSDSQSSIKDEVAIVVVANGIIYKDVLIKISDVKDSISEIENEVGADFNIFTNIREKEKLFPDAEDIKLADLLKLDLENSAVKNIADISKSIKSAAFIIFLLSCVGYYGFSLYQNHEKESEIISPIDPNIEYQASVLEKLKRVGFCGSTAISEVWIKNGNIDVSRAGFMLRKIDCDGQQCKFKWVRANGFTKDFADAKKTGEDLLIIDAENAEIVRKVKTSPLSLELEKLPSEKDFALKIITREQKFEALKAQVMISIKIGKPAIFGITNGIQISALRAEGITKSGKITIGAPMGLAAEVIGELPTNVAISNIRVTLDNYKKPVVEITGEYFVK